MNENKEMGIGSFFKILFSYKLFIFIIVAISVMLSNLYLFFKPEIYRTSAKIEVITYDKSNQDTNDLLQNTFYANKEVDKEIEKLTTFEINHKVIESMPLQVQFYTHQAYHKYDEIYEEEVPIKITKIVDLSDDVLRKIIKLTPEKNGYRLTFVHSYPQQLFHKLFKKKLPSLGETRLYSYGETVKTDYFQCKIERSKRFDSPIYFMFHGDSRDIYDNLVFDRLRVNQKNKEAPILEIFYEDNIPKRAMEYVNKLVELFNQEGRIQKSQRNNQISKFLEERLATNTKELKEAEQALEQYKIENKAIKISTQTDLIMRELSSLDLSISANNLQESMINSIMGILEEGGDFNSIGPLLMELNDRVTLSLLDKLHQLESEDTKLSAEYTNEYPPLMILHQQIEQLREQVIANVRKLESTITNKKMSLEGLKYTKESALARLPIDETNMVNLNRRYQLLLNMNDYLARKKNENDTIKAAIISDYKMVERAYESKIPIKPKKMLIVILSLMLGLLIGVIMALLRHSLSNKIRNLDEITQHTRLPIYGLIPFNRKCKRDRTIEVFTQVESFFSNAFRELRTNLQFDSSPDTSKVFLVTSMLAKEGKSSMTINLSAIFQLAGYKTIVLELDLRKPSLAKYFDISVSSGMSGYLSGKDNLSEIIYSTIYPNLDIIPAGSLAPNPSELILSSRIETLFRKLRKEYDYIIVDTASLSFLTDTINLMKYADINLVVVEKRGIRKSILVKIEKMAKKYHLKNIGLIINKTSKRDKLNDD